MRVIRLFVLYVRDVFFLSWGKLLALSKEERSSFFKLYFQYLKGLLRAHLMVGEFVAIRCEADSIEARDALVTIRVNQVAAKRRFKRRYYENFRFLAKYSSMKYDGSVRKMEKRISEYARRYNMGKNCLVQYGVKIICEHNSNAPIKIGNKVLLARDVDLDYTGGLEIGDEVKMMEGVKILTHAHDMLNMRANSRLIPGSNRAYKTPLRIGGNVQIASRALILPGVGEIGENSMISAGSVVTKKVPPRVVVAGNPAKIVAEVPEDCVLKAEMV